MKLIENNMTSYFNIHESNKNNFQSDITNTKQEENLISVSLDEKTNLNSLIKIPFAYVASVSENSPALEAGMTPGDAIVLFDKTLNYSTTNNPLQKIAEIVSRKVNSEIEVEILRNGVEYIKLNLIPHAWSGPGLLG
jgi:C-terminal processing protease CtpA/Prc